MGHAHLDHESECHGRRKYKSRDAHLMAVIKQETDRQTDRQAGKQIKIVRDRLTDIVTQRQTDRQTHTHTHTSQNRKIQTTSIY